MAKLPIEFSGIGGLVERHQGDLNDTSTKPYLRYLGADNQMADGIYNPIKKYGYLSPANETFIALTGTIAAGINSIQYDPIGDIVYMSEEGENILKLDGMDDISVSNYLSITSGYDIKDMLLYEVNGQQSLVYVIDSNLTLVEAPGNTSTNTGGMYIGFKTIDTTEGATALEKDIKSAYPTSQLQELYVADAGSYSQWSIGRKLAQGFSGADVYGRKITGISIRMRRHLGTGVGITLKVSIQSPATASTGIYTSRGAWADSTAYVINDTVTYSGTTYQCFSAHTSVLATNRPGTGSLWQSKWNTFGSPNGTILASQTFTFSNLPASVAYGMERFTLEFATPVTGLGTGNYWIVIEEVGSNMTASDRLAVLTTVNGSGIYSGYGLKLYNDTTTDYWQDIDPNALYGNDTMDFRLIVNRDDNWTANTGLTSSSTALGAFGVPTGESSFLYLADNGLLYWFVGNKVHTIDGSITGGGTGKINENILQFASYITIPDVAETRSRMYIGIQTSNITTATDPRTFGSSKVGVFIWDRRSQILGGTDFYPCPGAKEIKSLFLSSDGSVKAITVGNSGFTEIRTVSGNQFAVIHTFEKDGYPHSRRAISQLDGLTTWLGSNGIIYGYGQVASGEKDALYKLGDMTSASGTSPVYGPLLVGNEYSSAPQQAVLLAYTNSTPSYNIKKWYPNGDGTINSVVQLGNQGNIYSLVKILPELSKINTITMYCAPTTSTGSTVIATAKIYFNQSSTVGMTKSITQKQASRGYIHWDINKPNVNAIQIEIEHSTTETLGANDFTPSLAIIDYSPTTTHTPDGG